MNLIFLINVKLFLEFLIEVNVKLSAYFAGYISTAQE